MGVTAKLAIHRAFTNECLSAERPDYHEPVWDQRKRPAAKLRNLARASERLLVPIVDVLPSKRRQLTRPSWRAILAES